MAKRRLVNTKFWSDNYISDLDPTEKLLFLYLLTNPFTNICGIYEVPLKQVALDTGIDKEMVIKILNRFQSDGKIFYGEGWIGIKNFIKNQEKNPKVERGIELELEKVPEWLSRAVLDENFIVYDSLSHPNTNINTNPNTNSKRDSVSTDTNFEEFWNLYPRKENKRKALTVWKSKKISNQTLEEIITFLSRAKESVRWKDGGGRYVPHASTFLSQERWNDDLALYQVESSEKLEVIKGKAL